MADGTNIIKRLIQLVLDRNQAKRTQTEMEGMAAGVDAAWKSAAAKIAGYLGVAFLISKVVAFGKEAVAQAAASQAAWANLKGTIDGTGASFDALESKLRATADAFQDATIHDDDAFAESLTRMITLTGDVGASMNNMGLVANVAAQFFKGDLGPATDLVSKAMNGNVVALQKMGIHATDAQNALEILASRSMGAAEREAKTFSGQVAQLNNLWDDFTKAVGNAIIQSNGSTTALDTLRAAVITLTHWVDANKDAISTWVTEGVSSAIDAADVFIRAVAGMGRILAGGFVTSVGLASQALGKFIGAMATIEEAEVRWATMPGLKQLNHLFGQSADIAKVEASAKAMRAQADALGEWGEQLRVLGTDQVQKGIGTLSTPLFSSSDFTNRPTTATKTPGETNAPRTSAGVVDEEAVKKAKKDAEEMAAAVAKWQEEEAKLARTMATEVVAGLLAPNPALDQLKAKQALIRDQMIDVEQGIGPFGASLEGLALDYAAVTAELEHVEAIQAAAEAFRDLARALDEDLVFATLDGADALDVLTIKQRNLARQIQITIRTGIAPQGKSLEGLQEEYKQTSKEIEHETTVMGIQAAAADFLAGAVTAAMQGQLKAFAQMKSKQNKLEAAEDLVRATVMAIFGHPGAVAMFNSAALHAGLALAWGGLAASIGGNGGAGGGAPTAAASGATSGGQDITSARESSSRSTTNATTPSAEVSIYLVGEGFHAANPIVQRVVYGAQQQALERYGPNARVRVVPRGA